MKAHLKHYRQAPRKVRLVADLVRGKDLEKALIELEYLPKRASRIIKKLIESASANAEHNFKVPKEKLFIEEIRVDKGITLKRWRPRAKGASKQINKRSSNIFVRLGIKEDKE